MPAAPGTIRSCRGGCRCSWVCLELGAQVIAVGACARGAFDQHHSFACVNVAGAETGKLSSAALISCSGQEALSAAQ